MALPMIIIIVAGVVLMAFGVLCIFSITKAQRETRMFNERMHAMESNLDQIGKMVRGANVAPPPGLNQTRQQPEMVTAQKIPAGNLGELTRQAPQPKPTDTICIDDLLDDLEDVFPESHDAQTGWVGEEMTRPNPMPDSMANPMVNPMMNPVPKESYGVPYTEESTLMEMPGNNPQIQHFDYDIGKSGKRYTASEIESLIRE